jgi:hypothetical protein
VIPETINIRGVDYDPASLFSVEIIERAGGELRVTETDLEVLFPADIAPVLLATAAVELVGLSPDGVVIPSVGIDAQTGRPVVSIPLDEVLSAIERAEGEGES